MKNNTTFIAFLGSRGSGKTTIADIMSQKITENGYRCNRQFPGLVRRPISKALYTAIYLWRFFDFELFRVLGFLGRSRRWFPSLYRLYVPLAFAYDLHKLTSGQADVLVYDSNILRGLISAVMEGDLDPSFVADIYDRKVLPKVGSMTLVVVETDPEESVRRWIARDAVELAEADRAEAIAERIRNEAAMNNVVDALAKLSRVQVVRLRGERSPEDNATRVIDSLSLLPRRSKEEIHE